MAEQRTTPGMKAVLTIAGSDSSGGAGIQADLKTWAAMRLFGCTAITAITAQNTRGVGGVVAMEPSLVAEQIDKVATDINCQATKTGMIASPAQAKAIAKAIDKHHLNPLVVDPVLVAKSGDRLADDETMRLRAVFFRWRQSSRRIDSKRRDCLAGPPVIRLVKEPQPHATSRGSSAVTRWW